MFLEDLHQWFSKEMSLFQDIAFVRQAFSGKLTREHYVRFLLDYRPLVQNTSRVYSLAAAHMPPSYGFARDWFCESAYKECGHERFIHQDLKALGVDAQTMAKHPAHPMIEAWCGYSWSLATRQHPAALLGLPFLMGRLSSALSLQAAGGIQKALGLQEQGASFFFAHGYLDQDQPHDVDAIIAQIVDTDVLKAVRLSAEVLFSLYQQFFRSYDVG